ncbi:MAG TPA: ribonuclease HII [Bacillales bacterium]|nr:ribonuclease HII [Bacillales bacterium]
MKRTIHEIKKLLFSEEAESLSSEDWHHLYQDKRKGVQQLLVQWQKQKEKIAKLERNYESMSTYEQALWKQGDTYVAGVDEAGRGPLAGPVVAAAVILNPAKPILGLNDSKQLTETIRESLYHEIKEKAVAIGIGRVEVKEIDRLNIYHAAKLAMTKAIGGLNIQPDHVLVDAMELPITVPQTSIIKGDCRSVSIAAGSIIAKVTRDHLMKKLAERHPYYGFSRNFGYGTAEHLKGLEQHGVCDQHRRSFAPVKNLIG